MLYGTLNELLVNIHSRFIRLIRKVASYGILIIFY